MQKDKELIETGRPSSLLRFYEWESLCITTGIFVDPKDFVDLNACAERGIEIAKRPTGGGLLFHGKDIPFTLFYPTNHPLYALPVAQSCERINREIVTALSPWLYLDEGVCEVKGGERCQLCMAQKTVFDILWSGYKIGGCAQRKTKEGLLHQVSLFFENPCWDVISRLLCREEDLYSMQKATRSFETCMKTLPSRREIQKAIKNKFLQSECCDG